MKYILALVWIGLALSKITNEQQKQINGFNVLINPTDNIFATCTMILFKEMVDFNTADQNCKNFTIGGGSGFMEGNLVTVNDDEKNAFLKMLLIQAYPTFVKKWDSTSWVWAGLRKTEGNVGVSPKGLFVAANWTWSDGTTATDAEDKYWMSGQPDQKIKKGEYQNQMRISKKGKWDDTFASKTHPYACDYQGKYIFSNTKKRWDKAKTACENAGLILAKVRDLEEVKEFKSAAVGFLGGMTGKLFNNDNWMWLGALNHGADNKTNDWQWLDGTNVTERYEGGDIERMPFYGPNPDFATKKYKKEPYTQNCLTISKDGEFDDSSWFEKRPFACQCPDT